MGQVPRKACIFGFALQTGKGEPASIGDIIGLPLPAGESLQTDPHFSFLHYADGRAGISTYVNRGTWMEGDVRVPMIPGSCVDLFDWIVSRDQYWQGVWATVWVDLANTTKKWTDVKVVRARFSHKSPEEPDLSLSLRGRICAAGESLAGIDVLEPWPYVCDEVSFAATWNGTSPVADLTARQVQFTVDNNVETGDRGMRIAPQIYPQTLDNEMGQTVEGSIERDFSDGDAMDAFLAGQEGALELSMVRDGYTSLLSLPRIVQKLNKTVTPDSGFVNEPIEFTALDSTDGAVACIDMSESGGEA